MDPVWTVDYPGKDPGTGPAHRAENKTDQPLRDECTEGKDHESGTDSPSQKLLLTTVVYLGAPDQRVGLIRTPTLSQLEVVPDQSSSQELLGEQEGQ